MSKRHLTQITAALFVFVAAGLMGTSWLYAAPPERGSVSGRVVQPDGKPVVGLALRLERFQPRGMEEPGSGAPRTSGIGSGAVGLQGKSSSTKILGRATTNQNGEFSFTNIEVGGATLAGGNERIGWVYHPVEIEANKDAKMGDVVLTKPD